MNMSELKQYLVTYNVVKKTTIAQNRVYTATSEKDAMMEFECKGVKAAINLLAQKGQDAEFEFRDIEIKEISTL
jgi:hypothetical protein